jgi:EmrB/QacA subfamily drug resistance transporter
MMRAGIGPSGTSTGPDSRRWLGLAVICAAQLLVVLDASVVNIALPSAQAELGMSDVAKQWVVTGYSLTFGGFLLLGGRIADLHGRKNAFLVGLTGFALASLVGGLAGDAAVLLVARAAQGMFAALLAPAALALLATTFTEPVERGRAFGIFGAAVGTGGVAGMVVGGVLTDYASWRWCLLINLPVVALILVPAMRLLTDSRAGGRARYDLPGAVTGTLGVGALIYGISRSTDLGWLAAPTLAFVIGGLVSLAVFVVIEHQSRQPMMPLRILRSRVRAAGYVIVFLIGAALYAFYLFLTYFLQVAQEHSPLVTGLAFVPIGVGIFLGASVAGRPAAQGSPRLVVIAGLLLAAVGTGCMAVLTPDTGFWPVILPVQLVVGFGAGASLTMVMKATLDGVHTDDTGVASALTNAMREIGGAVGISALNTVAIAATVGTDPAGLTRGYVAAFVAGAVLLAVATLIAVVAVKPGQREHAR